MENCKILLEKLNEEQIKPVLDTEGAVLVIAGAGSGKTRVLTSRIAYLVLEKGVSPENIMAITFTNKAAGEMKERLAKLVGDIDEMWVSTIHSMCVKILRRHIDRIGYDKNFTIYDDGDKERVLKHVLDELGYDQDKFLKTVKSHISNAKNECLSPGNYKRAHGELRQIETIYEIYKAYENELARANSLDFDDLLFKTYELFAKCDDVVKFYANKFQYIHIDEFQDTNKVQFAIAEALSSVHGNLFVVGDDDQSIYSWRGAKIENILTFDKIFTGAKVYKLERNYRSTKKILQLANCIISNNTERRPKELWTDNDEGVRVETFVGTDENNEAGYVAMQIKNIISRSSTLSYSDFAVFMRVNALSRAFEQEFLKYDIPYKVFGGFRFFERKEIKDVLSYLKLINNPKDNESFIRSIACPRRGIGDKTLKELREFSTSIEKSMLEAIEDLDLSSISGAAKNKLKVYKNLIEEFTRYSKDCLVVELIDHILESTAFLDQFVEKSEENTSKIYNINELKNSADQFVKDNGKVTLADYLNSVTLSSDVDGINTDNAVTVATIHAAKGLEYKNVFVVGLDDKIIPGLKNLNEQSELEEERRLVYVAVTRAKERLYLTRANSRYLYGKREFMVQSRFLREAQPILNPSYSQVKERTSESLFERAKVPFGVDDDLSSSSFGGGYSSSYAKKMLGETKPKANVGVDYTKYKCGVKVKHAKFGVGTIITVKGEGDKTIADVAFPGVGIKALAVKFAPMEIL